MRDGDDQGVGSRCSCRAAGWMAVCAVFAGLAAPSAAVATQSLHAIALPVSNTSNLIEWQAVNASDEVVGAYDSPGMPPVVAEVWNDGTVTKFPTPAQSVCATIPNGYGDAIDGAGAIFGSEECADSNQYARAYPVYWSASGSYTVPNVGSYNGSSALTAASDNGNTAGVWCENTGSELGYGPCQYVAADVPIPPATDYTFATVPVTLTDEGGIGHGSGDANGISINNAGEIAVGGGTTGTPSELFPTGVDGSMVTPSITLAGTARELNDNGDVIGTSGGGAAIELANGTLQSLPVLNAGDTAFPRAINDSDEVVGFECPASGGFCTAPSTAVAWIGGKVMSVASLVPGTAAPTLYAAFDVNNQGSILANGVQEGAASNFLLEPSPRTSTTAVNCSSSPKLQCTATVTDTTGDGKTQTPTGSVSFNASKGSFATPTCTLVAVTSGAACSATFTPPTTGPRTSILIMASYGGDGMFQPSRGTTTLCPSGQVELDSIASTVRHDNGFELDSDVVLTGCGFAAGDVVRWGNDLAQNTLTASDIGSSGKTAAVSVPWLATSGDVSVSDGSQTTTLADQQIDSFRNTEGLNFSNYVSPNLQNEMQAAFVTPMGIAGEAEPDEILDDKYEEFLTRQGPEFARCFGFAVVSGELADGSLGSGGFGTAATPYGLPKGPSLQNTIEVDWWKQFASELYPYAARRKTRPSGLEIYNELEEAFGTDGYHHPALVSIDWRPFVGSHARSRWEGHTVLAFAVRDTPTDDDPGEFTIYTYNSNDPFDPAEDSDPSGVAHSNGQVFYSSIVVQTNGSWTMAGEGASGTAGTLEVVPISAVEGPLHLLESAVTTTAVAQGTLVDALTDPSTGKAVDLASFASGDITIVPREDSATSTTEGGPGPGFGPTGTGPGIGGIAELVGPLGDWTGSFANTSGPVGATVFSPDFTGSLDASRSSIRCCSIRTRACSRRSRREGRRRRDAARWH